MRPFDPDAFATFVVHHKLVPWLVPAGRDRRAARFLSAELREALQAARHQQPRRTDRLLRESVEVRDVLGRAGVESLFLKGLCLAARFYEDPDRRHQWDLDVLVPLERFRSAVDALGSIGFAAVDPFRVDQVERRRRDAWHAVSLERGRSEVDLHWTLTHRALERGDERHLWSTRRVVRVRDVELETLSTEDTLVHLLRSIALDLRRGALRAKLWLDLYRVLGALEPAIAWELFLERRDREGLLGIAVNVFSLYQRLWGRSGTLTALTAALDRHAARIVICDDDAAVALVTRPRRAPENRAWFERVHRRPRRQRWWGRRLSSGAAAGLPAPLAALLEASELAPVRAKDITPLPGARSPRRSYWIALADGREVKGRLLSRPEDGARMERWLPGRSDGRLPGLLSRAGTATLEAWLPGRPCPDDVAVAGGAGSLLGEIHTRLEREPLAADDPRLRAWSERVERWTATLLGAGRLDDLHARRVLERARDHRPKQATWGLQHGDFARENLVVGEAGLCCVDNVSLEPGVLEADLAHTFYRWPMSASQQSAFRDGYLGVTALPRFPELEPFWPIAVALRAAATRLRTGAGVLEVPLRSLERHAG